MGGGEAVCVDERGGRQDPSVCICVTTVSGGSLGCWGGRCWSFSSRPAKLPRVRRKEGGEEDGGWCWGQVEGGGGRVPIPELSWVGTYLPSCQLQPTWLGQEKKRKRTGWTPAISRLSRVEQRCFEVGTWCLFFLLLGQVPDSGLQGSSQPGSGGGRGQRCKFAGLVEGYQVPVCTSIGIHWTLLKAHAVESRETHHGFMKLTACCRRR